MFKQDYFIVKSNTDNDFTLVEPLVYKGKWDTFTVPAGWVTDFASVPTIFTWLIPRYGIYTRAAILHDYLCDTGIVSRRDADGIFRRVLRELGVSFFVRWIMWAAVRVGGRMSDATGKEWAQFIVIGLLSIPYLLIPTLVVGLWTLVFKIADKLGR